ncbi:MAG: hypothetical protein WBB10_27555 [Rhodococcus qingshengii]
MDAEGVAAAAVEDLEELAGFGSFEEVDYEVYESAPKNGLAFAQMEFGTPDGKDVAFVYLVAYPHVESLEDLEDAVAENAYNMHVEDQIGVNR